MAAFPNKAARQSCWDARDKYWECLDAHSDNASQCTELRELYQQSCPSQWVKHFDRKRSYLKFKDKIQNEGSRALEPPPAACSAATPTPAGPCDPPGGSPARRHRVYRELVTS